MRIIHLLVIGILVFAAAYVYRIKMESTSRTERVLRLHAEIREQRDAIAVLRAEWAKLDAPPRLQGLAERHLALKPLNAAQDAIATARPDIIDRNGEVLATDVKAPSLFGEPRRIIDKDEAIELLTATLPDLDTSEVRDRLSSKKGFVWLKREITPLQQQEIHRLGVPGIGFLRDELLKAKDKYKAKAASGLVSNVKTGEIVAMVSLPDFDPNNPREAHDPERINRLTTGVYEMGSTFKALTLAMALDSGKATLNTMYDARGALHYGKFAIHDTHPEGRAISLSEVFTFSSNVGAARIALAQGVETHKAFLRKMGQLDRLRTELPES